MATLGSSFAWATHSSNDKDKQENQAISQSLRVHVETLLKQTAQAYGWQLSNPSVQVTLPSGSHRLTCSQEADIHRRDNRLYPTGRLRFTLSCPDEAAPWSIQAQAYVDGELAAVYAAQTIAKDAVIQADDLRLGTISLSTLNRGVVTDPKRIIHQRAQRQIRQGQLVAPERVSEPFIVQRGDKVIMEAKGEDFAASMAGIALENGFLNQQIRVRNNSSGKVIKAVVVEHGKVQTLF
ncbi:flagellar basal body P-ring formation chaperone FlgA [Vibrio mexicanus]|uniref:flagellar basal body P-ring formation chaperone FlgA n=1 Tax=Vibrio mexicanus TaxID=1004326 RepID=UPI00063C0AC3|nr:flagellar basal body P-ring formation chaperone FlgA [Vibrio mexicanus]